MTLAAPTYDLVLLLDSQAEDAARTKILVDARTMIGEQGELVREDGWGERALAYPIDKKASAEYHLLQFHATTPDLLSRLDRTLRIADEIVRFRIVKLKPGTPDAPDMGPARRPEAEAAPAEPTAVAAEATAVVAEPTAVAAEPTAVAAEPTPDAVPTPAAEPTPVAASAEPAPAASEPA